MKKLSIVIIPVFIFLISCQSNSELAITNAIRQEIAAEQELKNTSIYVKTVNHKVQLSGYTTNASQQLVAVQIAMDVPGVKEVENVLILKKRIKYHKKILPKESSHYPNDKNNN